MKIPQNHHKEVLILLVEIHQGKQHFKEGVCHVPMMVPHLSHLLMVDDVIVRVAVLEHIECSIYPDRKLIDEPSFFLRQRFCLVKMYQVCWIYVTKGFFVLVNENLRKDKDTILDMWVIHIAHIINDDLLIEVFKKSQSFQNLFYIVCLVLISFN